VISAGCPGGAGWREQRPRLLSAHARGARHSAGPDRDEPARRRALDPAVSRRGGHVPRGARRAATTLQCAAHGRPDPRRGVHRPRRSSIRRSAAGGLVVGRRREAGQGTAAPP